MKILHDKLVTRNENREVTITRWVRPKGYKLAVCEMSCNVFKSSLILCFGKSSEFKKFVKEYADYDCDIENANALYVYTKIKDETYNFILIQEFDYRAKDFGTLCHELHHFTHLSLERIGIDYGRGGEEVFAYFQGHFMEMIIKAFVELSKKYDENLEPVKLKTKHKNK